MKPISVNFGDVTSGGGFYIEPGTYKAKITKVTQGKSPGGEYPYLEWSFDLFENGHVTINDRTSLSPKALFRLYGLMEAATGKTIAKTAITFDPEKLVGLTLVLRVVDRAGEGEYAGKVYSQVKSYMSNTVPAPRNVTPSVTTPTAADDDEEDLPFN